MSFIGKFADLTGVRIGSFRVHALAGRDYSGVPRWEVLCKHGHLQVIGHHKLVAIVAANSPQNLQCSNLGCLLHKSQANLPETADEFRRRTRREAAQAAQADAEAQAQADEAAAKEQAKQQWLDALKAEYRQYLSHQNKTECPLSAIVTFKRWQQLHTDTRKTVLDALAKDARIWFENL